MRQPLAEDIMRTQHGKILILALLFILLFGGALFLRYQQIVQVRDFKMYEQVRQQLRADLLKGDLDGLYSDLEKADLAGLAKRVFAMTREEIVIGQINRSRPLHDFSDYGESIFQVTFSIEENGKLRVRGNRFMRFVNSPDQGWRYLGSTDARHFYTHYLIRKPL
jgi:hypothetical protein